MELPVVQLSSQPQLSRHALKLIARHCPLAYGHFWGRKFLLPNAWQGEYGSFDLDNWMSFERLYAYAGGTWNYFDEVANVALWNVSGSLHYNRPTYYLERELGEALLRTDLLEGLSTADIKWPFEAFRIVLPKNLISIQRDTRVLYLTHIDICHAEPKRPLVCPVVVAREVDKFVSIMKDQPRRNLLEMGKFLYKQTEAGVGISAALDQPENQMVHQTIYGVAKPWGSISLGQCRGIVHELSTPLKSDDADNQLLNRLELLALNILLYMSSAEFPEYVPDKVIRRENVDRLQPSLIEARFLGRYNLRPRPAGPRGESTGRSTLAHWVRGHWQRIVYGPNRSLRRPAWIKPYATGELRGNELEMNRK